MPDSSSLIGQTFSHYRILQRLGGGGMGLLPVRKEIALPELPHDGLTQEVEANDLEKGIALDHMTDSVLRTDRYSYTRVNVRRNIFRVPIS
jgi:hypothetical protein